MVPQKLVTSMVQKRSDERLKEMKINLDNFKTKELLNLDVKGFKFPAKKNKRSKSHSHVKHSKNLDKQFKKSRLRMQSKTLLN